MVSAFLAAAGTSNGDHFTGTLGLVPKIAAIVLVVALVASVILFLVVTALVVILGRSNMEDAAGLRRFVAWVVRRSGHPAFRKAGDRMAPDQVGAALATIRARDEYFNEASLCDAALRAAFFTYVLSTTGDRKRLEQVVTPEFWDSPMARDALERSAVAQRSGGGPHAMAALNLDFQAGNVEVTDAVAGQAGTDRVTVRVAYRAQGVARGALADRFLALQRGGLAGTVAMFDVQGVGDQNRVAQMDTRGWVDWELVRPVGQRTSQRSDDWRCGTCGAPFHSDLDVECGSCHTSRSTPEGAWRAGKTWLIEA